MLTVRTFVERPRGTGASSLTSVRYSVPNKAVGTRAQPCATDQMKSGKGTSRVEVVAARRVSERHNCHLGPWKAETAREHTRRRKETRGCEAFGPLKRSCKRPPQLATLDFLASRKSHLHPAPFHLTRLASSHLCLLFMIGASIVLLTCIIRPPTLPCSCLTSAIRVSSLIFACESWNRSSRSIWNFRSI